MKKVYLIFTVAILTLIACNREGGSGKIDVTVGVNSLSVKSITQASSKQGGLENVDPEHYDQRIVLEIWSGDKVVAREVKTFEVAAEVPAFNFQLEAGTYNFVAWSDFVDNASNEDKYYTTDASLKNIVIKGDRYIGNSDARDAYTGSVSVNISETNNVEMTLKRPFAKIRVLSKHSTNPANAVKNVKVTYKTPINTSYNAVDQTVGSATISNAPYTANPYFVVEKEEGVDYLTVAWDYLFVGSQTQQYSMDVELLAEGGATLATAKNSGSLTAVTNKITSSLLDFFQDTPTPSDQITIVHDFEGGSVEEETGKLSVLYGAENRVNLMFSYINDQYAPNQGFNGESSTMINNDLMGSSMVRTAMGMGWYSKVYNFEDVRDPKSRLVSDTWNYRYKIIYLANDIIKSLEGVVFLDKQSNDRVRIVKANVHALRAYMYYQLAVHYAPRYVANTPNDALAVPLITDNANKNIPRNTLAEVLDFAKTELQAAYLYMCPEALDGNDSGDEYWYQQPIDRMTFQSIRMMQARLALYMQEYQNAYNFASRIVRKDLLRDLYFAGFSDANNLEVIWSSYSRDLYFYSYFAYLSSNFPSGSVLSSPMAIDMRILNAIPDGDRRKELFLRDDQPTIRENLAQDPLYYVKKEFTPSNGTPYPFISKKFRVLDPSTTAANGDVFLMRLAESFYIVAEAQYLLGNEASAKSQLGYVVSAYGPYDTRVSGEAFYTMLKNYKLFDLYGEGRSFEDYKRRGDLIDRTNSNHLGSLAKVMQLQSTGINSELFIMVIPQSAIAANPLLVQN